MAKRKEPEPSSNNYHHNFLPSGSTLLNLALSGHPAAGYMLGASTNIVGDSSSGKTFLALNAFAEAAGLDRFADYRFIYDGAEYGASGFDISETFGPSVARRFESPYEDGVCSETIQDAEHALLGALAQGPCIYVIDSYDALTSREEKARAEKEGEGDEDKATGTYGLEKTKRLGQLFRRANGPLKSTRSSLIVISQVRENIDPKSFLKKYRTGGKALDFYPSQILWLAIVGKIKRKETWTVGVRTKAQVTKTRATGLLPVIEFSIRYDYGLDDIESCISWLVEQGIWGKSSSTITAPPPIDKKGMTETLIQHIEKEGLEKQLRVEVAKNWKKIQTSLTKSRKKRYG